MSCHKKGQVITTGGILKNASGKNLDLREALDELAQCCGGYDCCNKTFRAPDQTTGTLVELYFDDGDLKFDIGETTYTVTAT